MASRSRTKVPRSLPHEWGPPLRDGVGLSGIKLGDRNLVCAFYGRLFRPPGSVRAVGDPHYRASDVTDDEAELLQTVLAGGRANRAGAGAITGRGNSRRDARFRAGCTSCVGPLEFLRGTRRTCVYRRAQASEPLPQGSRDPHSGAQAVDAAVDTDTRVLVAHSLGTVVAYEALHGHGGGRAGPTSTHW